MANVMIVDDSIFIRRSLTQLLSAAGHIVIAEAENGHEAFEKYIKYKPDLVTMDITMHEMTGLDAIAKIIKLFPNAKIIVVSAHNEKPIIFEALQKGAKNYIFKPIYNEDFLLIVNQVLEN